jgi:hypothetical protein
LKTAPGSTEVLLLCGRLGCLLFGSPLFNDTIVFDCTFGASANLFASWIVSHRGKMMRVSPHNGKERSSYVATHLLFIYTASDTLDSVKSSTNSVGTAIGIPIDSSP